MPLTNAEVQALLLVKAVGETIRDMGMVPSGHLYAALCGKMSLETYEKLINKLVETGLVERGPHFILKWVGPEQ